jgi:uncharacterized small protein (DUF1192 family)
VALFGAGWRWRSICRTRKPVLKPQAHEIGQDLSRLSVVELEERIALLRREIERLGEARLAKEATKLAADAFFAPEASGSGHASRCGERR